MSSLEKIHREGDIHRLRVNVKSLAAESTLIRHEIQKARYGMNKGRLHDHKMSKVRPESRLAQLALAFVKGIPYKKVENSTKNPVMTDALYNKIRRFTVVKRDAVERWLRE